MSLVWLELEELTKGRSGVALTQFSSSSNTHLCWLQLFCFLAVLLLLQDKPGCGDENCKV
jgi:hypothetical protein